MTKKHMTVAARRLNLGVDGNVRTPYTHARTSQTLRYIARTKLLTIRDANTLNLVLGTLDSCQENDHREDAESLRSIFFRGADRSDLRTIIARISNCVLK